MNKIGENSILENLPGAVLVYKADSCGEILYANRAMIKLFECRDFDELMELTGGKFSGIVVPQEREYVESSIQEQIARSEEKYDHVLYQIRTKSGKLLYIEYFGKMIEDPEAGWVYYVFLTVPDERIRDGEVDYLTGLKNRRAFLAAAEDFEGREYGLIYFNIRGFKLINQYHGSNMGDIFLKKTANILSEIFAEALIARFSADHFVVLFDTGEEDIESRIREAHDRVMLLDEKLKLSLNAGIYLSNDRESTNIACDFAKMACDSIQGDEAKYLSYYTNKLREEHEFSKYIASHLDEAIQKGYIQVFYQPVIRTMSGKVCSMEALARWIDPDLGMISPGRFIPVLEEDNLIYKLDIYMIEEVTRHLARVHESGKEVIPVSLNISRRDFDMFSPYDLIEWHVRKYRLLREWLHIELTESAIADNTEAIKDEILKIREGGYEVWLDDFGSGYFSLNSLKDYPVDEIKFDMVFLHNFNDRSKTILTSAVSMAKKLGIHTLAEGVETKEQLEFLRSIGCEKIQGYLYGRPEPYEDMLAHIHEKSIFEEKHELRTYYEKIGLTDLITNASLGLFDYDGSTFKTLYLSPNYWVMSEYGETASEMHVSWVMNSPDSPLRSAIRSLVEKARASKDTESMDCVFNARYYRVTMRVIASRMNGLALQISLADITFKENEQANAELNNVTRNLVNLFETICILNKTQYTIRAVRAEGNDIPIGKEFSVSREEFGRFYPVERIYEEDRETLFQLIEQREDETDERMDSALVRFRNKKGNFEIKEVMLLPITLPDIGDRIFLLCARRLLKKELENICKYKELENVMHRKDLDRWKSLMDQCGIMFFWKDRERRFLGSSKSFLEYFGFENEGVILGKTDEDMGWHIDDSLYRNDEEDVIHNGKTFLNVPGHVIKRGIPRNIFASKFPTYENGEINGLIGYFIDADSVMPEEKVIKNGIYVDEKTGLMNLRGLIMHLIQYEDNYLEYGEEYGMIILEIPGYYQLKKVYGKDTAEEMMGMVAEILKDKSCNGSLIARTGKSHLIVLQKGRDVGLVSDNMSDYVRNIEAIRYVNDYKCTLYVKNRVIMASDRVESIGILEFLTQNKDKIVV